MDAIQKGRSRLVELKQEALARLAASHLERMARRVVHALQRRPATGMFSDRHICRSLWDELCHDHQSGLHNHHRLECWSTMDALMIEAVDGLTLEQFDVLWLANLPSEWKLSAADREFFMASDCDWMARLPDMDELSLRHRDAQVILQKLREKLMDMSYKRDLTRLEARR